MGTSRRSGDRGGHPARAYAGGSPGTPVQLGQATGPTITLRADVLRSSGLEIVGSDAGTVPVSGIMKAIPEFMALAASGELPIEVAEVSLADVESAWQRVDHGRRIVFRP